MGGTPPDSRAGVCRSASHRPGGTGAVTVGHSGWNWGNPLPQGQTIKALEFDGARGYAAGDFGTVLTTEDSGATWSGAATGVTESLDRISIVDQDSVVVSGGCIVRRSDDGGRTFVRLPWTASDARCGEGVVDPGLPGQRDGLPRCSEDGSILRTEDGGRTWARRTAVPGTRAAGGNFAPTDIAFTSPSEGIASTSQGHLYRTTDAAVSWTLVRDDPGVIEDVHFVTPTVALSVGSHGVLRTEDGGATWEQQANGPALSRIRCVDALTCIATTPSGQSLMRTSDGGVTFTSVSPSSTKLLAAAFAAGPAGRCGGRRRRHRGVGRRRYHLGAARGAPGADVHAHQGGVRVAGVRGGTERDARAHERRRSLVGAARRLHLRGRGRRVVRRRASSATRSTPPAPCFAPRMAVSRGRS